MNVSKYKICYETYRWFANTCARATFGDTNVWFCFNNIKKTNYTAKMIDVTD